MLKNLILRLYHHPDIPFQIADKFLRTLEPLEIRSETDCLRMMATFPEVQEISSRLGTADLFSPADQILEYLAKRGIKSLCRWEDDFPLLLREIPDAPPIIFYQGILPNPKDLAIGIVGARKATPVGIQAARDFSRVLAENQIAAISGLAEGIDTAVHEGALAGGGYTLAVQGCGLNNTYPASNVRLRRQILDGGGGILSEFPPALPARTWNFPRRNRIISGISSGVIIIEAGLKSGSLITAKYALDQGRDLFAVPGSIRNPVSMGTNQLIKYGAVPVTEGADILNHYALTDPCRPPSVQIRPSLSNEESQLICVISTYGAITVDGLSASTEFSVPQILGHLASLEIKGAVERWITGEYAVTK